MKTTAIFLSSIVALPMVVNGQVPKISSFNQGVSRLVKIAMDRGNETEIKDALAPAIGLPKAMLAKSLEAVLDQKDGYENSRYFKVIYEEIKDDDSSEQHPICLYLMKYKLKNLDRETLYLKTSLDGKLEKAVIIKGKYDKEHKPIQGSGSAIEQDIEAPEIKKIFKTEMSYWLNDWLKKQGKGPGKE